MKRKTAKVMLTNQTPLTVSSMVAMKPGTLILGFYVFPRIGLSPTVSLCEGGWKFETDEVSNNMLERVVVNCYTNEDLNAVGITKHFSLFNTSIDPPDIQLANLIKPEMNVGMEHALVSLYTHTESRTIKVDREEPVGVFLGEFYTYKHIDYGQRLSPTRTYLTKMLFPNEGVGWLWMSEKRTKDKTHLLVW